MKAPLQRCLPLQAGQDEDACLIEAETPQLGPAQRLWIRAISTSCGRPLRRR